MRNAKKVSRAVIIAYIIIAVNTFSSLVLAPYIIGVVGKSQYGVFNLINSFTSALLVLDFGLGQAITRFVAVYKAKNDQENINKLCYHSFLILGVILLIISLVSVILYPVFELIYSNSLSSSEMALAKIIYWISIAELLCLVVQDAISGFVSGSNCYDVVNFVKLLCLSIRIAASYVVLIWIHNVTAIVVVQLCACIFGLSLNFLYMTGKLKIKPEKTAIDKHIMKSLIAYTGLLLLSTIASQIDSNTDNMVIGAFAGVEAVAVYSFGIRIYKMVEQLSSNISLVMLPAVSNLVVNQADHRIIEDFIAKVGKIQYMLIGAVDAAFIIYGKGFVTLWLGEEYIEAWTISLILMLSSTIPLIENVTISVLRAKNYMLFRVVALFTGAILNLMSTVVLVKEFGYIYAACSTAICCIVVRIIIMNIYYYKRLGLHMLKVLWNIMARITVSLVFTAAVSYAVTGNVCDSWRELFIKVMVFCLLYAVFVMVIGFSSDEKKYYYKKLIRR